MIVIVGAAKTVYWLLTDVFIKKLYERLAETKTTVHNKGVHIRWVSVKPDSCTILCWIWGRLSVFANKLPQKPFAPHLTPLCSS